MNLKLFLTSMMMFALLGAVVAQQSETQSEIQSEIQSEPEVLSNAEISFEENTFEFGTIDQGEVIQNVFVLTNTGSDPLVISAAKGSCGCTVPKWPKEPILPGETAEILVKFNSKGKRGKQSKRVTLTTNANPAQTFLTIKGEIIGPKVEKPITNTPQIGKPETSPMIANANVEVSDFVIYPNPATHEVNVKLSAFQGAAAEVQIFDQAGKLMNSQSIDAISGDNYRFDVSDYPNGTYVVSTKVAGKMRVAKQISIAR